MLQGGSPEVNVAHCSELQWHLTTVSSLLQQEDCESTLRSTTGVIQTAKGYSKAKRKDSDLNALKNQMSVMIIK